MMEAYLANANDTIATLRAAADEDKRIMNSMADSIDEHETTIKERETIIKEYETTIENLRASAVEDKAEAAKCNSCLLAQENIIWERETSLKERDTAIAEYKANHRILQATIATNEATIAALQTELGKTKAELAAMATYQKGTEEMLRVAQVTSDTTIDGLRRDLRRIKQELDVASTKLTDERCAWHNERNKWNIEREYLVLAAGNHEDTIITRFRKYIDAYPCGTKRPRANDDAGDGGRAP